MIEKKFILIHCHEHVNSYVLFRIQNSSQYVAILLYTSLTKMRLYATYVTLLKVKVFILDINQIKLLISVNLIFEYNLEFRTKKKQ